MAYSSDTLSRELAALLRFYGEFAKERDIVPVVIFIPRDKYDRGSATRFVDQHRELSKENLLIGNVGTTDMNWDRYNLLDTSEMDNIRFCHPSPYGHRKIAEYIADFLLERDAWPSEDRASRASKYPM
jgi:hypothetical protein